MKLEERQDILTSGSIRIHHTGCVIFHEGEPCAGMYVLLKGQIQLHKYGPEGKKQILSVINPVIMFNEVPVLDRGPNVATAVASKEVLTWHVACDAFHVLLHKYPQIGLGLLGVLAARNRLLMSHYEDLSFRPVVARTAKLLLDLSGEGQNAVDRQNYPNIELAARVAAGPESFSRSLGALRKGGYIHCTRENINILNVEALADLALLDIT
ncbi:MAG: Crp/Fnr family transcriptional regulator [Anaerolineae bacterium]|nr:Crp/Fnr family transcriptional regulator [Anaerolineae bacterium]